MSKNYKDSRDFYDITRNTVLFDTIDSLSNDDESYKWSYKFPKYLFCTCSTYVLCTLSWSFWVQTKSLYEIIKFILRRWKVRLWWIKYIVNAKKKEHYVFEVSYTTPSQLGNNSHHFPSICIVCAYECVRVGWWWWRVSLCFVVLKMIRTLVLCVAVAVTI